MSPSDTLFVEQRAVLDIRTLPSITSIENGLPTMHPLELMVPAGVDAVLHRVWATCAEDGDDDARSTHDVDDTACQLRRAHTGTWHFVKRDGSRFTPTGTQ